MKSNWDQIGIKLGVLINTRKTHKHNPCHPNISRTIKTQDQPVYQLHE